MTHPQIGRALRLMNMEKNGTPTVAEFEALLTDQGRVDALVGLLQRPGALAQLAGYPALYQALDSSAALQDRALTDAAFMKLVASIPAAMTGFISSQSALTAISENAAVRAAFIASTALTKSSVPKMTSNTTPAGVASASSEYDLEYQAWRAFDKSDDHWIALTEENQWVQYKFPVAAFIHTVFIQTYAAPFAPKNCRIEFSDDGVVFSVAKTIVLSPAANHYIDVSKAGFHKYWRLYVVDTTGNSYISLHELDFIGFAAP